MKKTQKNGLIGGAILALIILTITFLAYQNQSIISFTIDDQTIDFPATNAFKKAIRGEALSSTLDNNPLYTLKMTNGLKRQKTLFIYEISESRVVLGKVDKQFISDNPDYFYTDKAFESFYLSKLPQVLKVNINQNDIPFSLSKSQWTYKNYIDEWVEYEHLNGNEDVLTSTITTGEPLCLELSETPSVVHIEYTNNETLETYNIDNVPTDNKLLITPPDTNGTYTLKVSILWNDEAYYGQVELPLNLIVNYPLQVSTSNTDVEEGALITLNINHIDPESPIIITNQETGLQYDFYSITPYQGVAYVPVPLDTPSGDYTLVITQDTSVELSYTVNPRNFKTQYLSIDESIEETNRSDAATEEFNSIFEPLRLESSSENYTSGAFILPVQGRLSTEFGERRFVNGSLTSYRHSGLDIAVARGTEVKATNRGKVVLARQLTLTGKTLLIDHGQGIFSAYFHLDTLDVNKGNMVDKGQIIGTVGTTGFSTGPHLHFILNYYDKNLEPGYILYGTPVLYSNYKTLFGLE